MSKRHRRRKKEDEVVKPKPWLKSIYGFRCKCGQTWNGVGRPIEVCGNCGREVWSVNLFKESR